jgi:hypothetical protein
MSARVIHVGRGLQINGAYHVYLYMWHLYLQTFNYKSLKCKNIVIFFFTS